MAATSMKLYDSNDAAVLPSTESIVFLISDIFMGMGYSVQEGPEVEYVKYNFELLRIPEGHPARDEKDTFYVNPEVILRTQTSPVQVRTMETVKPPFKMICPGRVYRTDTPDATHSPIFHQIEGMVVDKNVAMSDLVGTLQLFARELFGADQHVVCLPVPHQLFLMYIPDILDHIEAV